MLSMVVKWYQIIPQRIHHIILALQKTHLKTGYINTWTPLNTKLKRIAPNSQTKYGTKRKINKRYHLSGTWKKKPKHIPVTKRCILCLSKKFHILFSKERLLKKRNEIISKCRHENKHKLSNYKIQLNEGKCIISLSRLKVLNYVPMYT